MDTYMHIWYIPMYLLSSIHMYLTSSIFMHIPTLLQLLTIKNN